MQAWVPFAVAGGGLVLYALYCERVRSWLDDLDRARHIREMEADERERKLACDPAGLTADDLGGEEIDETDERFLLYQRNRLGDAFDWLSFEVEDTLWAINALTRFDPEVWSSPREKA